MSASTLTAERSPPSNQPAAPTKRPKVEFITAGGAVLFLIGLAILGSGFSQFRPKVGGLLLHPYLIPVLLTFPFLLFSRIHLFPFRTLAAMIVFAALYIAAVLSGGEVAIGEMAKVICAGITIICSALLVRRRSDFTAGVVGMTIAVAALGFVGLQEDTEGGEGVHGIDSEVANKNAYSLFALPPLLMGGYLVLRYKDTSKIVKGIVIASTLPILATIFMSANRSGYLGAVVVGMLLIWEKKVKGMFLIGLVAAAAGYFIMEYGNTAVLERRLEQTTGNNSSDELRIQIFQACLQIGLENPLFGASPGRLPLRIGERIRGFTHMNYVDPHNVFGQVWGGCGIFCFAALAYIGISLWFWRPQGQPASPEEYKSAHRLMRLMLILWVVRGMFTREILYSPSFCMGVGMVIGLCIIAERMPAKSSAGAPAVAGATPRLALK